MRKGVVRRRTILCGICRGHRARAESPGAVLCPWGQFGSKGDRSRVNRAIRHRGVFPHPRSGPVAGLSRWEGVPSGHPMALCALLGPAGGPRGVLAFSVGSDSSTRSLRIGASVVLHNPGVPMFSAIYCKSGFTYTRITSWVMQATLCNYRILSAYGARRSRPGTLEGRNPQSGKGGASARKPEASFLQPRRSGRRSASSLPPPR